MHLWWRVPPSTGTTCVVTARNYFDSRREMSVWTACGGSEGSIGGHADGSADLTNSATTLRGDAAGAPFDTTQPYIVLNWCIAPQGIYPAGF